MIEESDAMKKLRKRNLLEEFRSKIATIPSTQDKAKDILLEYVEQFERKNKNVFLYNASIHTGENGSIHLHADVIFWANCSRGQRRQASLTKALAQMGYTSDKEKGTDGKRLNAITKWEMEQREILRSLCKAKDIEIIAGRHSKEHLAFEQYQCSLKSSEHC